MISDHTIRAINRFEISRIGNIHYQKGYFQRLDKHTLHNWNKLYVIFVHKSSFVVVMTSVIWFRYFFQQLFFCSIVKIFFIPIGCNTCTDDEYDKDENEEVKLSSSSSSSSSWSPSLCVRCFCLLCLFMSFLSLQFWFHSIFFLLNSRSLARKFDLQFCARLMLIKSLKCLTEAIIH